MIILSSCNTYDKVDIPSYEEENINDYEYIEKIEDKLSDLDEVDIPSYEDENINDYEYSIKIEDEFSNLDFMVASDIHYFSDKLHDDGQAYNKLVETSNGQMQHQATEILNEFVRNVIAESPDCLILTGDLTLNGEKQTHVELASYFEEIESHGIDVYVVPGNHDINNVYARSYFGDEQEVVEYVDYDEFYEIYSEFGPDKAKYSDESSFSYVVEEGNVWLLMIDSAKYSNNISKGYPESSGELRAEQAKWFEEILNLAKQENKEILTFMHHNMVAHADVSSLYMMDFMLAGAEHGIAEYLASHDMNVVFSGHIHCHDIAGIRYEDEFIYDITTGALIVYPHNYRIFHLNENGKLDIETRTINKLENDDSRGMSFDKYSEKLASRVNERIKAVEGMTEYETKEMQEYARIVANAYFEGNDYSVLDKTKNLKGYSLWTRQEGRMSDMIIAMSHDTEPRDKNITIDLNTGYWSD